MSTNKENEKAPAARPRRSPSPDRINPRTGRAFGYDEPATAETEPGHAKLAAKEAELVRLTADVTRLTAEITQLKLGAAAPQAPIAASPKLDVFQLWERLRVEKLFNHPALTDNREINLEAFLRSTFPDMSDEEMRRARRKRRAEEFARYFQPWEDEPNRGPVAR